MTVVLWLVTDLPRLLAVPALLGVSWAAACWFGRLLAEDARRAAENDDYPRGVL